MAKKFVKIQYSELVVGSALVSMICIYGKSSKNRSYLSNLLEPLQLDDCSVCIWIRGKTRPCTTTLHCTVLHMYTRMYVGVRVCMLTKYLRTISDKFGQIQTSLDQFQQDFQKISYLIKLLDDCLQKFVKTRQCTICICTRM